MIKHVFNRRKFLYTGTKAAIGASLLPDLRYSPSVKEVAKGKRIGIIGLDTSHSAIFTKAFNENAGDELRGFKVTAACSQGSRDIASALENVPATTEEMKRMSIPIVNSIEELLDLTDVILLETNDGRVHLEQVMPVFKAGKPVFIDKPIAASLSDAMKIFHAAEHYNVPVFSSSALRFMKSAQAVAGGSVGEVMGADTYSPATIEKTHPDFYWYGIHGIEILFTVMGTGCSEVRRVYTPDTDVAVGVWDNSRLGTFRGLRNAGKGRGFGGTAFGKEGIATLGPFDGYDNMLMQIAKFFETGIPPVSAAETLEICAFIEAADESKAKGGTPVYTKDIMHKAEKKL
jgi:hypothetical protein